MLLNMIIMSQTLRGMAMANNEPTAPVSADEVSSLGQRWYVLMMLLLVYTISIADRYVF